MLTGLKQTHGLPMSIGLDNLSIHNHSNNPPLGLCLSGVPLKGPLEGMAPRGGGGVSAAELRRIEEAVMARMLSLEQVCGRMRTYADEC